MSEKDIKGTLSRTTTKYAQFINLSINPQNCEKHVFFSFIFVAEEGIILKFDTHHGCGNVQKNDDQNSIVGHHDYL